MRPLPPPKELAARIRRRARHWNVKPKAVRLAAQQESDAEKRNERREGRL